VNRTETTSARDRSAVEIRNKINEDNDLKCEYCIRYETELTKVLSDLKLAIKIIENMKEQQKIDDSLLDKAVINIGKREEEFYPLPRNENWTQIPVHVQKKEPLNSSKTPFAVTRHAKSYEASHNLDKGPRRHFQINSVYLTFITVTTLTLEQVSSLRSSFLILLDSCPMD
jgi:hypothetical protein